MDADGDKTFTAANDPSPKCRLAVQSNALQKHANSYLQRKIDCNYSYKRKALKISPNARLV